MAKKSMAEEVKDYVMAMQPSKEIEKIVKDGDPTGKGRIASMDTEPFDAEKEAEKKKKEMEKNRKNKTVDLGPTAAANFVNRDAFGNKV